MLQRDDSVSVANQICFDSNYIRDRMVEAILAVQSELTRPSVLFKAKISLIQSNPHLWACSYGQVHGFGASPDEASRDFDLLWAKGSKPVG